MQLYTAFFAQAYSRVMRPLRIIFFFRFISWFAIGISIFYFGQLSSALTLWFIGTGLFAFSFCAGLGTIYFHELMGKVFTNDYRGVTWAYRQIFMGLGGVLSGTFAAWLLTEFEEPRSFALAFMAGSGFMVIGYLFLGTAKEFPKKRIQKKENKFSTFLVNAFKTLKYEKDLKSQIIVRLISYSCLFVLPFIVKYAEIDINLYDLRFTICQYNNKTIEQ